METTFNAVSRELHKTEKYVLVNINKNLPPFPRNLNAQNQWRTLLSSLCLSNQLLLTEEQSVLTQVMGSCEERNTPGTSYVLSQETSLPLSLKP